MHEIDESQVPRLPARPSAGHKGTFGTVAVVGGSAVGATRMVGAPALSARAAVRGGCGLVRLVCPEPVLGEALTIEPSATGIALEVDDGGRLVRHAAAETLDGVLSGCDALAIGPGLGTDSTDTLALRAVNQQDAPVVVDADALNVLAEIPELAKEIRATAVLTPHPGEFRRLAGALKIEGDPTSEEGRPRVAAELARRLGVVVALKGAGTVVSDGLSAWVCDRGHPCLGAGGTGDVLTGLVASLIAQYVPRVRMPGLTDPNRPLSVYDAARCAVWAHARAGEIWAERNGSAGLRAVELADLLPVALDELRRD